MRLPGNPRAVMDCRIARALFCKYGKQADNETCSGDGVPFKAKIQPSSRCKKRTHPLNAPQRKPVHQSYQWTTGRFGIGAAAERFEKCPSGLGSSLEKVLEDVCKKQGFSPEDYDLKFQRTVLDLSLQWRFASLPNNAKLEMVPSTRQRVAGESRVRIALQLEDGSRVQDSFSSAQTLWDLISYFPQIRYVLKKSRSPEGEVSMETAAVSTEKIEEPPHAVPDHRPPQEPRPAPPTQSPAPQPHTNRDPEPQPTARPKTCPTEESVRPKTCPPEDLPGPSGARPSQAPPSGFVPFSGGGQRLGGDTPHGLGMTGDTPRNYSSTTAGPPKAKKHKPSNDAKHPANAKYEEWSAGQGEEFLEPVDREPLVYHMDAAGRCHSSSEDLPDEFFEVTVDDIRKRFAQLKSERKLLEEAPLMTKALREVRMKEKMERYPKVGTPERNLSPPSICASE
ncbi:hypothetical protein JZ751_007498 [Albula glossodonta]|uniref:TUG ubiquitin-like domain-containing protein n=1 Tax=Albula glossodonta TaxID=121402 RepID=A0A8T2NA54_9TELE|nr:hypothetical protein JZ751_007498 [Albula glossodonta]